MSKDRTTPLPGVAAAIAHRETMRNARMVALEARVREQNHQIRSLRSQLAASVAKARALQGVEAAE